MIKNAKDISLGSNQDSGLPDMAGALDGWMQSYSIKVIIKEVVDFEVSETENSITFQGVVQPVSPRVIEQKPEGQRDWRWIQIHSKTSLNASLDDKVIYDGVQYRIMQKSNYSHYGYFWYQLMEDYTNAS